MMTQPIETAGTITKSDCTRRMASVRDALYVLSGKWKIPHHPCAAVSDPVQNRIGAVVVLILLTVSYLTYHNLRTGQHKPTAAAVAEKAF